MCMSHCNLSLRLNTKLSYAVMKLEMDIQMERQRLEDLRKHLEQEKNNNNELLKRLKMQTKVVTNLQMERDLMKKKTGIHEERLQRYL